MGLTKKEILKPLIFGVGAIFTLYAGGQTFNYISEKISEKRIHTQERIAEEKEKIAEEKRYIKENTFTDTAIVKDDELECAWSDGRLVGYKIFTKKGKLLRYVHTDDPTVLRDLEFIIGYGTKIKFTGYPDQKHSFLIYATKIEVIDDLVEAETKYETRYPPLPYDPVRKH